MTRGLTGSTLTAVTAEQVIRTMAVECLFDSGAVRFAGTSYDIVIGGYAFSGVGMLGQISAVEESAALHAAGMTVSLSGIPADMIAIALDEPYQGRSATVWEVPLSGTTYLPIADPVLVFRGRMDLMEIGDGETLTVSMRLENRLADWERARVRRYTDEDHQSRYPGDRFFEFVSASAEKEIIWPARSFWS